MPIPSRPGRRRIGGLATLLALAALPPLHRPAVGLAEPTNHSETPAMQAVRYRDHGAKGDGVTDDLEAIVRAHAHANQRGLPVRADDGATYYIGGRKLTAIVQTDTDWGDARFVIDDTTLEDRGAWVFRVTSALPPVTLEGVAALRKGQPKLDATVPRRSVVIATNKKVRRFIRFGANQNSGSAQVDVFIVEPDGRVDPQTPILWDFDEITDLDVLPIDEATLTIRGGRFTTIANRQPSEYKYHARGIAIVRSNVVLEGLEHHITGEGEQGAPYMGFINISRCAHVAVRDTVVSGHKTYTTIGSAGTPVDMGSYDLHANLSVDVRFVNCTQANDIMDGRLWGVMASNFCKGLRYERCSLSRFDAHQGVYNATIVDTTLGHIGINAIGGGTLLVENSTINGRGLVNLRGDYGSTWHGAFIIRNCVFVPGGGRKMSPTLINGSNSGQHDFGYACAMPQRIVLENLRIEDGNHPDRYDGPAIFGNFNRDFTDAGYVEKFPYTKTREVVLKNVTTASGKPLRVSDNPVMFRDVTITRQ